ncbi:MAG: hypothetical protein Q4G68_14895 [Planctomycetia bacterium]|nr:hypothetical protein [Planctomycetia bacterium]
MKKSALLIFLVFLVLSGCEKATPGRYSVSGQVTLAGVPMNTGRIIFEPLETGGEFGPTQAAAPLVAGKYKVEQRTGLAAGDYRVKFEAKEVDASKTKKARNTLGQEIDVPVERNLIPDDFGVKSEQTVTITEGENVFHFEIPARPAGSQAP